MELIYWKYNLLKIKDKIELIELCLEENIYTV